jgi:hypothetical protein
LIRRLLVVDHQLEILAVAADDDALRVLSVIAAGASDYANSAVEPLDVLVRRTRRLINRGRRHRSYLHLLRVLYQKVKTFDAGAAERIVGVVPQADQQHIRRALDVTPATGSSTGLPAALLELVESHRGAEGP